MIPSSFTPIGTIIPYSGSIDPDTYILQSGTGYKYRFSPMANNNTGWILCDGSKIMHSMFPNLFNKIGYLYGGDSGSGLFQVPDYQGYFLRGFTPEMNSPANEDRTPDTNLVGSTQENMVQLHQHNYILMKDQANPAPAGKDQPKVHKTDTKTTDLFDNTGNALSGSETRPLNIYVHYLIYAGLPGGS